MLSFFLQFSSLCVAIATILDKSTNPQILPRMVPSDKIFTMDSEKDQVKNMNYAASNIWNMGIANKQF